MKYPESGGRKHEMSMANFVLGAAPGMAWGCSNFLRVFFDLAPANFVGWASPSGEGAGGRASVSLLSAWAYAGMGSLSKKRGRRTHRMHSCHGEPGNHPAKHLAGKSE